MMVQIKRFADKKAKNNRFIDFPVKLQKDRQSYTLVGTVEHSGTLDVEHYKAKCWNEKSERRVNWYHFKRDKVVRLYDNLS